MLYPALVTNTRELEQILRLQQQNLQQSIDAVEMQSQGFVTLQHDLSTLKRMHELAPSVIIKDGDNVVAYALTMLRECRQLVPDLEPMFTLFDKLSWNNKALNDHSFYVMGQVCVAKPYRGKGLFEQLYYHHRETYQPRHDLLITEIATRNLRSVRAHERLGFTTIHIHRDQLDEWMVVGWDWG